MKLQDVNRGIRKHKKRKRIGRGPGSGTGKTAGRGHKGQRSRSGWSAHPTFQGGAMPLVRRVPKRGFNNRFALKVVAVNVSDLERFEAGSEITTEQLREKSLIPGIYDLVKILGDGTLSKKLTVHAHRFSKTAKEKIEQAGGTAVVVPGRKPVPPKKPWGGQAASSEPVADSAPAADPPAETPPATEPEGE